VSNNITFLLLGGLICLVGLAITGMWLMAEQKRQAAWAARREATIGGYLKPKSSGTPVLLLSARQKEKPADLLARIHSIFNWREERRSQYPMTWWGVALVMAAPAMIAGLLATKLLSVAGWIAVPIVDILLTRSFLGWCANRISRDLLSQFPDALSMVSRSVRVGVPLGEAIKVVSKEGLMPTREEFGRAADAVAIGMDLEAALVEMADRNDLAEYRFFATALALQSQTGGGLTETLDTLADTIRKREAARKRGNALASEAKTSIYVLVVLPIISGLGLWLTNPDYISILFVTSGGQKLLALAVFMLCMGMFSMQQIIKRTLS
jgi:tight adherence protein B